MASGARAHTTHHLHRRQPRAVRRCCSHIAPSPFADSCRSGSSCASSISSWGLYTVLPAPDEEVYNEVFPPNIAPAYINFAAILEILVKPHHLHIEKTSSFALASCSMRHHPCPQHSTIVRDAYLQATLAPCALAPYSLVFGPTRTRVRPRRPTATRTSSLSSPCAHVDFVASRLRRR
ncbi:uncharacterized protein SCHCODRAFT_02212202 [Schizophyllum commune H4-8]|uniref:uncharacterized protein n=1 Tax=Schizophyllum commune (strain H4-8 / FGSC 9210) TaxID=578458 RepID=UPI002160B41C|nr:uncharacterized protein SCHCODRAFT_02212202 [Schizophyllum commune H4-8]KAI5894579.1 hypothetical protein SCHCODRAFT_02212202 [Schizophyllum commune H4-8]